MSGPTKVTTAGGLTLVAEEAGFEDGPAVLLLSGTAQPRALWAAPVAGLTDAYRVLTFDARDAGDSDRAPGGYDTAGLADDAVAVLDAFGVERAHVAGLSLGGCVALQLGLRHPDRVRSLCTASCWARVDAQLASQFRFWIDLMDAAGFGMVFRLMSYTAFSLESQELMGDMAEIAESVEAGTDAEAFRRQVTADLEHSLSDGDLGRIAAPLLALSGTEDLIVLPRHAEMLANAVPNAESASVEGVSHSMVVDHPERYTAALRSWFDRNPT